MIPVNPPPMIRLPQSMRGDPEVATYYRHLDRMLLQLWKRTGGNDDYIADLQEDSEATIDNINLSERIKQLEETESPITDLSVIQSRLNDIESEVVSMASGETVEFGGLPVPTALYPIECGSNIVNIGAYIPRYTGCQTSGAVDSTTLTDILNITGSGVLTFAALAADNLTVSAPKLTIDIDGVEVFSNLAMSSLTNIELWAIVGSFHLESLTGSASTSEGHITFNSSLVIKAAGDGVDGVTLFYKYYLT